MSAFDVVRTNFCRFPVRHVCPRDRTRRSTPKLPRISWIIYGHKPKSLLPGSRSLEVRSPSEYVQTFLSWTRQYYTNYRFLTIYKPWQRAIRPIATATAENMGSAFGRLTTLGFRLGAHSSPRRSFLDRRWCRISHTANSKRGWIWYPCESLQLIIKIV